MLVEYRPTLHELELEKRLKLTSIIFLKFLISDKHLSVLPPVEINSSSPFNHNLSLPSTPPSMTLAEVKDLKWSCDKVTDNDEFVGRINEVDRFPQLRYNSNTVSKMKRKA